MPTTGDIAARYPNAGETPDGPGAFLKLAQDMARVMDPVDFTTALPMTGNWDGRELVVKAVPGARWRWSSGAWVMQGTAYFANAAARDSTLTAPQVGMEVIIDTGYYRYDGSTWRLWLGDTGWVAPTLGAGWAVASFAPKYCRINGIVYFQGRATRSTGSADAFTLQTGFRPAVSRVFHLDAGGTPTRSVVESDGRTGPVGGAVVTSLAFDGIAPYPAVMV